MEYGRPEEVIQVKNLEKDFEVKRKNPVTGNRERVLIRAVDNVSFNINKGEFVGLIGPNGEGKSSFMNIVTGKLIPDNGTIEWAKYVKVGYLDQLASYDKDVTVREVLQDAFLDLFEKEARINELSIKDKDLILNIIDKRVRG